MRSGGPPVRGIARETVGPWESPCRSAASAPLFQQQVECPCGLFAPPSPSTCRKTVRLQLSEGAGARSGRAICRVPGALDHLGPCSKSHGVTPQGSAREAGIVIVTGPARACVDAPVCAVFDQKAPGARFPSTRDQTLRARCGRRTPTVGSLARRVGVGICVVCFQNSGKSGPVIQIARTPLQRT